MNLNTEKNFECEYCSLIFQNIFRKQFQFNYLNKAVLKYIKKNFYFIQQK